jgi:hypothetical protein
MASNKGEEMNKTKVLFSVLVMGGAAIAQANDGAQTNACQLELRRQLEDGTTKVECLDQKQVSQSCIAEITATQTDEGDAGEGCGWGF